MARAQYRRAAQPGGFKPVQVGGQNIARMREESSRVAEGMRNARNAEIEDRKRTLAAMQEDAAYTRRAEEKNAGIRTRNAENELRQLQSDAAVAEQQFAVDQKAAASMFESVASISATAGKKLKELEDQRFEEDRQRAIMEFDPNSFSNANQVAGEANLQADEELRQGALDGVLINGGNPLAVAQARAMSPGYRYGLAQAQANYLLTTVYSQELQKARMENIDSLATAADNAEFLVRFKRDFLQRNDLLRYKPEMIRDGLTAVQQLHQGILTKSRTFEEKNLYQMMEDNHKTTLTQNPGAFNQNILPAFRAWARNPHKGGFEYALNQYEDFVTTRNPDGSYMFSMEQLGQAVLKEGGKPFAEEYPGRFADMKARRYNSTIDYERTQNNLDTLAYQKDLERITTGLVSDPSKANAAKAIEFFRKEYPSRPVPQVLIDISKNYTYDAIEKAKAVQKFESIPDGFITQQAVDTLKGIDYNAGKALEQRFAVQERKYNSGVFKEYSDAFKTTANGVTAFGSNKPNNATSIFLQTHMRAEYRLRVDRAVAQGEEFNTAAARIAKDIEDEVTEKKGKFRQERPEPGRPPVYPELMKQPESAEARQAEAKRRYDEIRSSIVEHGLEATLERKGSILRSKEEAEALRAKMMKPGFTVPSIFKAIAGYTNGYDTMVMINKQLEAQGVSPVPPPPSLDHVDKNVSPSFKALLYKTPSFNRSSRALGSANMFTPAIVPQNLGPTIQTDAQAAGINPAYSAALFDVMGSYSSDMTTNYAARLRETGSPVASAISLLVDQGYTGQALLNKHRDFVVSMYKYGGGIEALQMIPRSGLTNQIRQMLHGNPAMEQYRGGADGRAVFFDSKLHDGANEHIHTEFADRGGVPALLALINEKDANGNFVRIDPFTGKPYNVTSTYREGDPGSHGDWRGIDVAPDVNMSDDPNIEAAWYHEFFRQMGINPYQIK
jgi:hypothetical protein